MALLLLLLTSGLAQQPTTSSRVSELVRDPAFYSLAQPTQLKLLSTLDVQFRDLSEGAQLIVVGLLRLAAPLSVSTVPKFVPTAKLLILRGLTIRNQHVAGSTPAGGSTQS